MSKKKEIREFLFPATFRRINIKNKDLKDTLMEYDGCLVLIVDTHFNSSPCEQTYMVAILEIIPDDPECYHAHFLRSNYKESPRTLHYHDIDDILVPVRGVKFKVKRKSKVIKY